MAFPSIRSSSSGSDGNASPTNPATVTLPATINSGDALLVYFWDDTTSDETITWDNSSHGTWTNIFSDNFASTEKGVLYAKVADGTEDSGTLSINMTSAQQNIWFCLAIQDWYGALAGIEAATPAQEGSPTPDPPSLTPSWGSDDTFWITCAMGHNASTLTTDPTNYTGLADISHSYLNGAIAYRANATATEDPGTWTFGTSRQYILSTVGIRPAAAGGGDEDLPPANSPILQFNRRALQSMGVNMNAIRNRAA